MDSVKINTHRSNESPNRAGSTNRSKSFKEDTTARSKGFGGATARSKGFGGATARSKGTKIEPKYHSRS
jgi:hypothetical protein